MLASSKRSRAHPVRGGRDVVLRIFWLRHLTIMAPAIVPRVANKRGLPGYLYCGSGCRCRGHASLDPGSDPKWSGHRAHPSPLWRSVRALPDFWRLLELRAASQFGDGLFQAGLAGALLFNPERAAEPVGDRRRVRRAVPAVFAARPVRRRAAGPLGPAAGAGRRQPRPAGAGARRRRAAGRRRRRPAVLCRRADRQRLHPVRRLGTVGGAAARGAARAGGDDELGRHGDRRRGGRSWAPTSCWCRAGCSAPATARRGRRSSSRSAVPAGVAGCSRAVRRPRARPRRHQARDPRLGRLRGGHRLAARRRARCVRRPTRRRHPCPGWPRTGWCSASTRCWCWCMVRHTDTASVAGLGPRRAVRRRHRGWDRFWPRADPAPRCAAGAATPPPTARWRQPR